MFYVLSALTSPVLCFSECCSVSALVPHVTQPSSRKLTYFSIKKGKRKTVKSVTERFMRLHCGLWIRRKVQNFYSLSTNENPRFRSDLLCPGVNRPATKRNCGRRNLPEKRGWESMFSVTKHRANFWTKWRPLFGEGETGSWTIHTWSTTIGSTSKSNPTHAVISCFLFECNWE